MRPVKLIDLPFDLDLESEFTDLRKVHRSEGGTVYVAMKSGRWFVIIDQRTMAGLLAPDDFDLMGLMLQAFEFDSMMSRDQFVSEKGWLNV